MAISVTGCDPASRYGRLGTKWTSQTAGVIAAKPAVDGGSVFVGSWDGYEYAYDAPSGSRKWRTFLGQTQDTCDGHATVGVTSSPWLQGGAAYLGGGDSYWYALDSSSGGVLWKIFTGDNGPTGPSGGHYNWSSPAVHNGAAFIGVASLCDAPLVQGELLRVSLSTHQITNVWKVVPDGTVGGTIWTSPVVDAARNSVFVTTGNREPDSNRDIQPYGEAMVALDATTLAVKGAWSLPVSDPTPDVDFGTSPTQFRDAGGRDLVSAASKNGKLYAFRRDNVTAGPVWTVRLAEAGGPGAGQGGVFSNGFFDGQRLYYAGGKTTIAGKTYDGSIRAIDPATGRFLWERGLPAQTYGALTGANGMIVVPSFDALYVLDPASGAVLYANDLGANIYGAGTIANGLLYLGDLRGVVRALRFPSSPGAAPPTKSEPVAPTAKPHDRRTSRSKPLPPPYP